MNESKPPVVRRLPQVEIKGPFGPTKALNNTSPSNDQDARPTNNNNTNKPPLPPGRPSLPLRPAPIASAIGKLDLNDRLAPKPPPPLKTVEQRRATVQPTAAAAATVPLNQRSTASVEGDRWRFPLESSIPRPPKHSGRVFVYPSGRDRGTFVDEPVEEATSVFDPHRSTTSRQSMPQIPLRTEMPRPVSITPQIQSKLEQLEVELAKAIQTQDFELCVKLKPRITVLTSPFSPFLFILCYYS